MLDQDGVVALVRALGAGEQEADERAEGGAEAFPLVINAPDHALFVVEDDGLVVGLVSVGSVLSFALGATYAEVELLLLQPAYRRQGLGGRLIETAVAWARDRGCKELRVEPSGPQALIYYQRMGCRELAKRLVVWDL